MGIKIKNLQTGEFEKFNIPALKGEKGEPGEIEPSEKVDYIGKQHSKLRDTMNANVDYIIKTAIGEFNYLDYEGQHITATNSIEGHAKSAILSGQTLVNLAENEKAYAVGSGGSATRKVTKNSNSIKIEIVGKEVSCVVVFDNNYQLKANTKYTITFDSSTTGFEDKMVIGFHSNEGSYAVATKPVITNNGKNKIVLSTPSEFEIVGITIGRHGTIPVGSTIQISNMIVLEGEYTDQDIPYFTGMQSVKMPVLKTVGKNLFSREKVEFNKFYIIEGNLDVNNEGIFSEANGLRCLTLSLPQNENFTFSIGHPTGNLRIFASNKKPSTRVKGKKIFGTQGAKVATFNTGDYKYFTIVYYSYNNDNTSGKTEEETIATIQIEQGTVATTYEPHKSNILSTPEEVVLRSLSNGVCDTLNLNTGEYVQRIGEIDVLNTIANWVHADNVGIQDTNTLFRIAPNPSTTGVARDNVLSNKFPTKFVMPSSNNDEEVVFGEANGGNSIYINIRKSRLQEESIEGFKQWLIENPTIIQYELKTPIIKTVDLSDNHVYSYKGTTHYSCSSEEGSLVPTLSVKVPTDTQLTIQEQKATTQTLLIKNMDLQQSIKEVQAMNLAFNTALYNSFNSIREEVEDIKKHVSTNENLEGSF